MNYPLTISDRGTRMAARGRALGKTLGQMGINQKLQTGLRGYIPIAALGQAAYDWGQYRGSQMDQEMQDPNSVLSQQASNIRTAIANGFVPLDDGNFLNLQTNELSSYDNLIPQLRSQVQETTTTSGSPFPPSAYVETVEEPEATVETPTTPKKPKNPPKRINLKPNDLPPEDGAKVENPLSGLSALFPLLAMGGLGYYLGRK